MWGFECQLALPTTVMTDRQTDVAELTGGIVMPLPLLLLLLSVSAVRCQQLQLRAGVCVGCLLLIFTEKEMMNLIRENSSRVSRARLRLTEIWYAGPPLPSTQS